MVNDVRGGTEITVSAGTAPLSSAMSDGNGRLAVGNVVASVPVSCGCSLAGSAPTANAIGIFTAGIVRQSSGMAANASKAAFHMAAQATADL
jgi:hypothetical protein